MFPFDKTRSFFCLFLALLLAAPSSLWSQDRDLTAEGMQKEEPQKAAAVEEMQKTAALWVLSVGVSQYEDKGIVKLDYADNDALEIAEVFETQAGVLFREVYTLTLTNEQATRAEILRTMQKYLRQASQGDVILIFMAGHGIQDPQTGTYYFLPHNATMEDLISTGLQMQTFEEIIRRLSTHTNKLILLLDTCHSGAIRIASRGFSPSKDLGQPLIEELARTLPSASGQYILSASKDGEVSLENSAWRLEGSDRAHGAFTYSLLRGLLGEAADDEGGVWLSDLFKHVNRQVPLLTQGTQHPHGQLVGTDLPLFIAGKPGVEPPPKGSTISPVFLPAGRQERGKKWLWLLLGGAAVGGTAAALILPSDEDPPTGDIQIRVKVP